MIKYNFIILLISLIYVIINKWLIIWNINLIFNIFEIFGNIQNQILFLKSITLWHRKLSFIIFWRMDTTVFIFLACSIRWSHYNTFTLNNHLLILLLHDLKLFLKLISFILILFNHILSLQSLAERVLFFLLSLI